MKKGLMVSVYKHGSDCTNGGVTAKASTAILMVPGVEVFEPNDRSPALYLANWMGRIIAMPVEPEKKDLPLGDGWMFGGNFVYTSDSRFPAEYPIPVYDRREF